MTSASVGNAMDEQVARVCGALTSGDHAEATRLCLSMIHQHPRAFQAWMLLGDAHLAARRIDAAIGAFEKAAALNPGHALPFTRATTWRFRQTYGMPKSPRVCAGTNRIQCNQIGALGRFGNQILQYAFLRIYADRHGLVAECPDWIGRDLFDLDDPFPSSLLPSLSENDADLFGSLRRAIDVVYSNVNIQGYFGPRMSEWGPAQAEFRRLFRPGTRVRPAIDRALTRLRSAGRTVVAFHLRRGDFGHGLFWIAPSAWYLDWLSRNWSSLANPVLYLATDDAAVVRDFSAYGPLVSEDLGPQLAGVQFYLDFEALRNADIVATSNSTFSFTAALLNERATEFLRPHPERRCLHRFDPWQAPVML